jgi:hypothetical protein
MMEVFQVRTPAREAETAGKRLPHEKLRQPYKSIFLKNSFI